jgi:hypothetical protein
MSDFDMSDFNKTNAQTDFNNVESNVMPVLNSSEIRSQQFTEGFNLLFGVGKEFTSLNELREKAVEYGKNHNVVVTTVNSSSKEGKITLKCKHGGVYRAAKTISDAPSVKDDDVRRTTSTSRFECPMRIVARRNRNGMIAITRSVGEHNHVFARDVRTYAVFRKMEREDLDAAISMLKRHTPSAVLKVIHFYLVLFFRQKLLNLYVLDFE